MSAIVSMTRITSLSTLAITLLTACPGEESREKLEIGSLTTTQRERLVHAATSRDVFFLVIIPKVIDPTGGCPKVSDSGTTRTLVGGCTDADGGEFFGKLTISNGAGTPDPNAPLTFQAEQFRFKDSNDDLRFEGKVVRAQETLSANLTITQEGADVRVASAWHIVGKNVRIEPGSTVELIGHGYADASGEFDDGGSSGSIELRGLDILAVDLAAPPVDGCVPATLDGVPTDKVCDF